MAFRLQPRTKLISFNQLPANDYIFGERDRLGCLKLFYFRVTSTGNTPYLLFLRAPITMHAQSDCRPAKRLDWELGAHTACTAVSCRSIRPRCPRST